MTTSIDALLELTDRVQAAIDAGEWQRASDLEGERRAEIERLLETLPGRAEVISGLRALQQRTCVLMGVVEHHRRRVLREATMVSTGHTGAARYVENQDRG